MDRELIFQKLQELSMNDSSLEVAVACCKFLFCLQISDKEFVIEKDEAKTLIKKIMLLEKV